MTLQFVTSDGQPVADLTAWEPWSVTAVPADWSWQFRGMRHIACPKADIGVDASGCGATVVEEVWNVQ